MNIISHLKCGLPQIEELFEVEAAKLIVEAKVQLFFFEHTVVHSKYPNYNLPKHVRDLNLKETVTKLMEFFGT